MQNEQRDLLAEWLTLGREVLQRYYPDALHAVLVVELGWGLPAAQFVLTPSACDPSEPAILQATP